jgi:cyclic pyranopterin phosphate synthase
MMLLDRWSRSMTYLRVSVTDRCNLRCVYCMPPEGVPWQPHASIMRYEEIAEVERVMAGQGLREVRLTGGEPLVRPGLPDLVRLVAAVPGIDDLALTTNGILLETLAAPLAQAGLRRINVSLDTLQADRFARVSRGGHLDRVWHGLEAAEAQGLSPIKLNMVVLRGFNDDEIESMARLTLTRPWQVRFIELMPTQNQIPWGSEFPSLDQAYISLHEIRARLEPLGLEAVADKVGRGPAREFRLRGALGTIGFISPLGESFCGQCNRLRLTADGKLRPCLFSDIEVPLLPALRAGEPILPLLEKAVALKPEGHTLHANSLPLSRCMSQIGG